MVKIMPKIYWERFSSIRLWWAQVTVTPDESKIKVFSRGTLNGLNGEIPEGGQNKPISILGERLLWKKAQKKEKKNKTSEVINRIMPHFKPFTTFEV